MTYLIFRLFTSIILPLDESGTTTTSIPIPGDNIVSNAKEATSWFSLPDFVSFASLKPIVRNFVGLCLGAAIILSIVGICLGFLYMGVGGLVNDQSRIGRARGQVRDNASLVSKIILIPLGFFIVILLLSAIFD